MADDEHWTALPVPETWTARAQDEFLAAARVLIDGVSDQAAQLLVEKCSRHGAGTAAATSVLADLIEQGWPARVTDDGQVEVRPATRGVSPEKEKERVRQQELMKTREELRTSSVQRFIKKMETPREHEGRFVSIYSLMRDGRELAAQLDAWRVSGGEVSDLQSIIDPCVEIVEPGARCARTGLELTDIWRYFRHTWTNHYTTTPGRSMLVLVRDRAAPFHPVIGIASLASAVVQISERDEWIGWQSQQVVEALENGSASDAKWLLQRLDRRLSEVYVDDLIADELYWPGLWAAPTEDAVSQLRNESKKARRDHNRFGRRRDFSQLNGDDKSVWIERAESDLYRSKRCSVLADLLEARLGLLPYLSAGATAKGLRTAMKDPAARRAVTKVVRFTRAETVGTEIADLTVCGAVAPYNHLLGGKLVSMLAVAPTVVRAYHDRYEGYASQIASSLAGRPVKRPSRLVFVGTTSLYGAGSSQYNRVSIPGHVLGSSSNIEYVRLGRSRSFGTSHFSKRTVDSLVRLAEQSRHGRRVNSIFGEGASPKLRKVRDGIDLLGWPSDELLQHRRERIIYGIPLVENLRDYLLLRDSRPNYLFDESVRDDVHRITAWWMDRWLSMRAEKGEVLARLEHHTLEKPVRHGARVDLPEQADDQWRLFQERT